MGTMRTDGKRGAAGARVTLLQGAQAARRELEHRGRRALEPRSNPHGPAAGGASAATWVLIVLLLGAASATFAHDQVPGKAQARPVLLQGGDLYTVSSGVLPATDLVFEGGRITAIGKNLAPPAGAEVIDVSGQRVYPGLIAPHTTLGLTEIGAVRATDDQREVGGVSPEVAAHVAFNPDSELIPTVRSHGITTVQVSPVGGLIAGRGFLAHLDGWTKEDAAAKLVDGLEVVWPPAAVVQAPWVEESVEEQKKELAEARRTLRQAFAEARNYHLAREAGKATVVDSRWEAMRPVFRGEMPVYVLADDYRQIVEAVAFAQEQKLRLVLVGGREAHLAADLLKQHGVPVIVSSTTAVPLRADDDYDLPFKLPALLHQAGVRFCLSHLEGSAWDQRNLPLEAGYAAAFGLPQDVALRSITLSAAEILGLAEKQGSLEVGKSATLFVSRGDVMDMLGQRVIRMWIEGRAVDLDDRHKMLERKYRQKIERAATGRE